jgi:dihydrofolate reductase
MRLNLIYARARNGVIGRNNTLPWHLPEDLAHFKQHTTGCPVIMGRKTWDSLPPRFKPLPGRTNLVLTRDENWNENGCHRFNDLNEALQSLKQQPDVWIIGGAQIYALALPLAQRLVVTEIDVEVEGDAFAPILGPEWKESGRQRHVSATGIPYSFVTFLRAQEN